MEQQIPEIGTGMQQQVPQIGTGMVVFWLAVMVLMVVSGWKIFKKAGKPGWAVLVPFYDAIVMLQICRRPGWWLILLLIPIVNIIIAIILTMDLAKAFGHGVGFGIGLLLASVIFYPILAFDSSQYQASPPASAPPAKAAAA